MSALSLGLIFIGASALYAGLGVLLTRRILRPRMAEGHNDVLVPIFLTAGTMYAVLLAFLVIAVWETYDAAKGNVEGEAATVVLLGRETNGMQLADGPRLRRLVADYADAVIQDEWSIQAANGGVSNLARNTIGDMDREFAMLDLNSAAQADAQMNAQFLQTVSELVNERDKRNQQANESLPWVMWLVALGGGFIVVSMTFLLYMQWTWPHVMMSTAMAALLGGLLLTIYVLDHPFQGPLALTPEPFETALASLKVGEPPEAETLIADETESMPLTIDSVADDQPALRAYFSNVDLKLIGIGKPDDRSSILQFALDNRNQSDYVDITSADTPAYLTTEDGQRFDAMMWEGAEADAGHTADFAIQFETPDTAGQPLTLTLNTRAESGPSFNDTDLQWKQLVVTP